MYFKIQGGKTVKINKDLHTLKLTQYFFTFLECSTYTFVYAYNIMASC